MSRQPLWRLGKRALCGAGLLFFALASLPAPAKIDLVTLPSRDQTELSIYNSVDLALVRETRTLSFSEGLNEIQFSWANTLIDPTSLRIDIQDAPGLAVMDAVYPANTNQLIVWMIEAEEETSTEVEISYFASGLSWEADYIIQANREQTAFDFQQFTTVQNGSGEDFDNASVRVVVGEVNLVDLIADLARRGIQIEKEEVRRLGSEMFFAQADEAQAPMAGLAMARSKELEQAKEIIKQAVSEYHLFAVEGQEDIQDGWGKEFPEDMIEDIEFDLSYEIDPRQHGNQVVKFYKLKNDTDHELGEDPLPKGRYYVYSDDGRGGLRFEGNTTHEYIPVGEDVELNLGDDGMVLYEERLMDMERSNFDYGRSDQIVGYDETRIMELEITNSRGRAVPVKLTHYIQGDWEFVSGPSENYERVDQETVRWEFEIPAQSKKTITYEAVFHHGTRSSAR